MVIYESQANIIDGDGNVIIPKGRTICFIKKEDLVDETPIEGPCCSYPILEGHNIDVFVYESPEVEITISKRKMLKNKKQKKHLTPLQRQLEKERKDKRPWYLKFRK